jgi:predicted nuclease of predicted toxin-antitoxin system
MTASWISREIMKLLLDQGLPRSAATLLTAAGIDAVHVGDLGLASADDPAILRSSRIRIRHLPLLEG